MKEQKRFLELSEFEWRLLIKCLNEARSLFLDNGNPVEDIDELCLKLSEEKHQPIGIWGQRHHEYLRRNKRITLSSLQISGKLNDYLADIDRRAEEMFELLVKQIAESGGVTKRLKATDQMAWVGKMNNIRNQVVEAINTEVIYK